MNDEYTITEITKILDTHKTKIRRIIDELKIKAINENNRKYENSPKLYNEKSKNAIINHYKSETEAEQERNESETSSEHELNSETLDFLKNELGKSHREKQELFKALQEAQQLVNQQQQLSLQSNQKIERLELELKETSESVSEEKENEKPKKRSWFDFFFKKED